jgi:hypothetical protein
MGARRTPLRLDFVELARSRAPTVEVARRKLGGRVPRGTTPSDSLGEVVLVDGRPGVVLFANDTEQDVWLGDGVVRRVKSTAVRPFDGEAPRALAQLAAEVRLFASLSEGDRVRFASAASAAAEGLLIEKCRYGALVLDDEEKVLAVGFRRLWPAVEVS